MGQERSAKEVPMKGNNGESPWSREEVIMEELPEGESRERSVIMSV